MLLMPTLSYTGRRSSGGGGAPSSTQWRLYFPHSRTAANPATNVTTVVFYEIEMRGAIGGADQCNGGSADASSVGSGNGGSAANAFDNSDVTVFWSSSTGTIGGAEWIRYTFPTAVTVEELRLFFYGQNNLPTEIDIQYWDGAAWQTYWFVAFEDYSLAPQPGIFNRTVTCIAPTFSAGPTVTTRSGFHSEGDEATVSATHNGRTGSAYQWTRDGSPISGATGKTYTYQSADVGHLVGCTVTATNPYGNTSASSTANTIASPTSTTHTRIPAGDMQSGSDSRLTAGDMQSGSDLREARERTA